VTTAMVETMKRGAVVIDLAASSGGNCELTEDGRVVNHGGVEVHGVSDLSSHTPGHASDMYSKNVSSLVMHLFGEGGTDEDPEDEIAVGTTIVRSGKITQERVLEALGRTN